MNLNNNLKLLHPCDSDSMACWKIFGDKIKWHFGEKREEEKDG